MRKPNEVSGEARRGGTTVLWLGAVIGTLMLAIAGAAYFAADQSDVNSLKRESDLASEGLERHRAGAFREIERFVVWDEAVMRTVVIGDHDFTHSHLGQPLFDNAGYERSFVIDARGRAVYASANGEVATPQLFETVRGDVADIVAVVREERVAQVVAGDQFKSVHRSEFREVSKRPALVVAAPIVSDTGRVSLPPESTAVAISIKFLDGAFAAGFARTYLLRDLKVVRGPLAADAAAAVPVPMSRGEAAHYLTWTPQAPGSRMLMEVLPVLAGGLGVASWLAAMLVTAARRANRRLAASEMRANSLAFRDTLTGRANRPYFVERLGEVLRARGTGHIAVVYADLDGFKEVNDTLGHSAGDELLRLVGDRLAGAVRRKDDLVARFGGDEFAVMVCDLAAPDDADNICRRIAAVFDRPFVVAEQPVAIDVALGLSIAPDHGDDPAELMRRADIALHRAKKQGRGAWMVFEHAFEETMVQRRTVEQELRAAIEKDQLEAVFQPLYTVEGERLVGFEALVRWNHPMRGLISPGAFIPIAEETGLILRVDDWVLRRATALAAGWGNVSIAVNLSPLHFRTAGAVDRVRRALEENAFDPRRLEIEVTENVLLSNTNEAHSTLGALRALGVRIALDDFGTGYSSLGYIRRFVVDKIKIDRSFVQNVGATEDAAAIVECVVRLGRALGITVTAEGVENREQLRYLRACGCHQVQGFLLGAPMSAADAARLVEDRGKPREKKLSLRVAKT